MSTIYHDGDPEPYDAVWVADGPNGELVIGFELDEERHRTVVLTREAADKLALELASRIHYTESGSSGCLFVHSLTTEGQ